MRVFGSSASCFPLIRIGVLRAIMTIRRQEWKGLPRIIRRRVVQEGRAFTVRRTMLEG